MTLPPFEQVPERCSRDGARALRNVVVAARSRVSARGRSTLRVPLTAMSPEAW